jgi:hypothetical protein
VTDRTSEKENPVSINQGPNACGIEQTEDYDSEKTDSDPEVAELQRVFEETGIRPRK